MLTTNRLIDVLPGASLLHRHFVKHHRQSLRKCKATKKVNRICETTAHRSVRHGHAGRVACVFMRHHLVRQTRRIARCKDSNGSSEQAARPLQENTPAFNAVTQVGTSQELEMRKINVV